LGNKKTGNVLSDALAATRSLSDADVSENNMINILSEYFSGISSIASANTKTYAQLVIKEVANEKQLTLARTETEKVGSERQI
jgi:hypothetical protein